jgi:sulfur carrier protein
MMDISLNGAPHRLRGASLIDLLVEQDIDPARRGVAVAVNDAIVPRARWPVTVLKGGDAVEIVRPHAGG